MELVLLAVAFSLTVSAVPVQPHVLSVRVYFLYQADNVSAVVLLIVSLVQLATPYAKHAILDILLTQVLARLAQLDAPYAPLLPHVQHVYQGIHSTAVHALSTALLTANHAQLPTLATPAILAISKLHPLCVKHAHQPAPHAHLRLYAPAVSLDTLSLQELAISIVLPIVSHAQPPTHAMYVLLATSRMQARSVRAAQAIVSHAHQRLVAHLVQAATQFLAALALQSVQQTAKRVPLQILVTLATVLISRILQMFARAALPAARHVLQPLVALYVTRDIPL